MKITEVFHEIIDAVPGLVNTNKSGVLHDAAELIGPELEKLVDAAVSDAVGRAFAAAGISVPAPAPADVSRETAASGPAKA